MIGTANNFGSGISATIPASDDNCIIIAFVAILIMGVIGYVVYASLSSSVKSMNADKGTPQKRKLVIDNNLSHEVVNVEAAY